MHAILIGAMAGSVLSTTTSYLVTGRLFHRFQAATPQTWRPESWRNHVLAVALYAAAGAAMGSLFVAAGSPPPGPALALLATGVWSTLAACLLVQATYVRWHWGFVFGLLLEWLFFVLGVLVACSVAASHP